MSTRLLVPAALGDVVDRLTILGIKGARLSSPAARENVARERDALVAAWAAAGLPEYTSLAETEPLAEVNRALWDVEDELRALEAAADFGPTFVARARSVYLLNDRRAALKRAVNLHLGSDLVEEKQHPAYPHGGP